MDGAAVGPNQDRSTLSPKFRFQPHRERADAHRPRPFPFVCLIKRSIQQPVIFDEYCEMTPPFVGGRSSPAPRLAPTAENVSAELLVVGKDCGFDAQRARLESQTLQ